MHRHLNFNIQELKNAKSLFHFEGPSLYIKLKKNTKFVKRLKMTNISQVC